MTVPIPRKGGDILAWAREITREHNRNIVKAGAGLVQTQTDAGIVLSALRQSDRGQYVELGTQVYGPFYAINGRWVVVDYGAGTVTQQSPGTIRPTSPSTLQNQTWVDLENLTHYFPRTG